MLQGLDVSHWNEKNETYTQEILTQFENIQLLNNYICYYKALRNKIRILQLHFNLSSATAN